MKVFALVLSVFLVSVSSVPQHQYAVGKAAQARLITDTITAAIMEVSEQIREAGLDPLVVENAEIEYSLPTAVVLTVRAQIVDFLLSGLSNIAINRMDYSVLTSRLRFDISLPEILISTGDATIETILLGNKYDIETRGEVIITQPRIIGDIRIVGVIAGISSSINLDVGLGGVKSNIELIINDRDLSDQANDLIANKIPELLAAYKGEIVDLLEKLAWQAVESILAQ